MSMTQTSDGHDMNVCRRCGYPTALWLADSDHCAECATSDAIGMPTGIRADGVQVHTVIDKLGVL